MRHLLVFLASFTLFASSACAMGSGNKGKYWHFSEFINTTQYESVLEDPEIARQLKASLGEENYAQLQENMGVRTPIRLDAPFIIMQGNAPHNGGKEEAAIWVNLKSGVTIAGLLHSGKLTVFADPETSRVLPEKFCRAMREMAHMSSLQIALPNQLIWHYDGKPHKGLECDEGAS